MIFTNESRIDKSASGWQCTCLARDNCRMANYLYGRHRHEAAVRVCSSMTSIGVGLLRVFDDKVDADENKKHLKAHPAATRRDKDAWVLLFTEQKKGPSGNCNTISWQASANSGP